MGAALQSLTGAPMLLQAIANDDLIPWLRPFAGKTEPKRALYLTTGLCALAVLGGNIDVVAPVITMFFLLCYAFVNLACFLQAWLRDPNFRPTWRLFHWSTALVGLLWCVALMLFISWYFALAAIVIAAGVYKFIEYRGVDADWGDGLKGLSYQSALGSLLKLDAIRETHSKNWKPQILALVRMSGTNDPELVDERLVSFVRQLKKGRGLNMFAHVVTGNTSERAPAAQNARFNLLASLRDEGLEGFVEIIVAGDFAQGVNALIQSAGLGGLKPNTVMLGYPESWKQEPIKAQVVTETVNSCRDLRKAIVLVRGVQHFPGRSETLASTIDIWWVVHDGGMLLLLATLLQRKREWKHTRVRVFTVARPQDNTLQLKQDVTRHLAALRMEGTVEDPVELDSTEVSAFTYERTLEMSKRRQLQSALRAQLANAAGRNQQTEIIEDFERAVNEQHITESDETIRSLDTAVKLNRHIVQRSAKASLVILNLPPPKVSASPEVYMEYIDALSQGITRVLLVRGSGREVVAMNA
jgi:potassium/chloride transporter 4/5/6